MKHSVCHSKLPSLFGLFLHSFLRHKGLSGIKLVMLTLTVMLISSCDSSSGKTTSSTQHQNQDIENVIAGPADCEYWGDYAVVIHGNYKAQKMAEMSDPLGQTKKWITYYSAEVGSPAKDYFDSVLAVILAGDGESEARKIGINVCSKYNEDQMDTANFYDPIA
jgi:hypothetical protein